MVDRCEITPAQRFFQLLLLAASAWSVVYARFALGPLQETLRIDLSLSDNQMALLQGTAVAVPIALGAIPLGVLVDRYSRARLFLLFLTLNLAALVLTAFAPNLSWLFAARALAGLALAGIVVAAYSMVSDLYAPAQRGRATMIVAMGDISGAPAAFALGGILLALTGPDSQSWRAALLWMCVPLIPAALFALLPSPTSASIVLTLFLTLGFTINVTAMTLALIVIPGELRGVFVAVTLTAASLFSFGLAPLVVSSLSGALGGPSMIGQALAMVCSATSILGAIVFSLGRRHFPRPG